MKLSPNEIAAAIYWNGAQFGPGTSLGINDVQTSQGIKHEIPKPGSPERTRIENWLNVAIAICLSESGGDSNAKNADSSAAGLWQILVSAHGQEIRDAQTFWATNRADGKVSSIYDPMVNTMVAALVYQNAGNSWSPWQAFNTGAYKKNLGHGKDAYAYLTNKKNLEKVRKNFLDNMKNDKSTVTLAGTVLPGAPLMNAASNLTSSWLPGVLDFIRQGALAIGAFVLGAILILIGLWAVISHTRAGKSVKSAVKVVVP